MKGTNTQTKNNRNPDYDELTAIFDQFAPAVYKYTMRLCHDPSVGDQIVGDSFAQLLEQYASGKGRPTNLRSYLYQTAYRSIVLNLGNQRDQTLAEPRKAAPSAPRNDEQAKNEALVSALHNELTEEQGHLMILLFLEDLSLDDTASILDTPVDTIPAELRDIQRLIDKHPELHMDVSLILKKKRKSK